MNDEEKKLLAKMASGELDGIVGDVTTTSGGSTVWSEIKNGVAYRFKQGPGGKYFDNRENIKVSGVLHKTAEWSTDNQKLEFLQKYGWLMRDDDARSYSRKFKP